MEGKPRVASESGPRAPQCPGGEKTSQGHSAAEAGSQRIREALGSDHPLDLRSDKGQQSSLCAPFVPLTVLSLGAREMRKGRKAELGPEEGQTTPGPAGTGKACALSQRVLRRLIGLDAPLRLHLGGLFVPAPPQLLLLTPNGI